MTATIRPRKRHHNLRDNATALVRGERTRALALVICAATLVHPSPAQQPVASATLAVEPPDGPSSQLPTTAASSALTGYITDHDGASIGGAIVSLILTSEMPSGGSPRVSITTADGHFSFANLPSGPFTLSISAEGFAPQRSSGELHGGETRDLAAIALASASSTNVQVTASQEDIAQAQVEEEEKQRVVGVFPNFYVSYIPNPVPLTPKQKYSLALHTLVDPVSFVLNGVTAATEQATNSYAWGQGAQGFAKRYAAGYGTFLTGTLIGSAALPVLLKQDPRYFYKGTGSVRARFFYAVANSVICKGDNHHWQPNYSAIIGGLASSGLSNLYYPAVNRTGAGLTFQGAAIGTGIAAVANVIQEFVVRRLTPHVPPNPTPSQ